MFDVMACLLFLFIFTSKVFYSKNFMLSYSIDKLINRSIDQLINQFNQSVYEYDNV